MKKLIIIAILIIFAAAAVILGLRFFRGGEDAWLCQNSQWVKHGNPSSPMPSEPCPSGQNEPEVVIYTPQPNQTIFSPLTVEGKARGGNWFFEANAVLRLLDGKGNEIAAGNVTATTDWMTTDYVQFKGQLRFISPPTQNGTLIFQNDNPSGLPENQKEFSVPVRYDVSQTMKIKAFFGNSNLDPQNSCNKVFPVEREVAKTQAPARAALEELLAGPTFKEQSNGYFTSLNSGVKIQNLAIANETAKIDFDEQLEFQVGGSCRVLAIRSQITETLKQFITVKNVIISINGRTEDILQP